MLAVLQFQLWGQEIRKIDGERFEVHIVEKGHTLFAISKKYAVDIDDIITYNPEARTGIKIGEEILIPLGAVDKKEARDNPPEISGAFLAHKVERKETLYSISKKYGVPVDKIIAQNPEAKTGLQVGQMLKIYVGDVPDTDPQAVAPAQGDSLILHKVEKGQTLYSIARQYKVSVDSVRALNDGLPEGLKAGHYLRIPKFTEAYLAAQEEKAPLDSLVRLSGSRESYNVALMLPFAMDIQDSIFAESDPTKEMELYTLTRISAEMYLGVQLAVDSLVREGLNVDLFVYDVSDDLIALDDILHKRVMQDMHMIIGPLHRESYERVVDFAAPLGIPVVAPVPNQKLVPDYNGSCIVHTTALQQMVFLGKYVARMHFTDNIVVVDSDKFKDYDYVQTFLNSYQSHFKYGDTLRAVKLDKFGIASVEAQLSRSRKNIVVVPSSDLGFVSDFMNRLSNVKDDDFDIQVVGMEKWLDYHNVDTEYKNRFAVTVPSSTYLDFKGINTQAFIQAFREHFESDPGNDGYAVLGFDVAYFFLGGLMEFGLDFPEHFDEMPREGVHMGFRFESTPTGCLNRHVFLLQFADYDLMRLN